MTSQSSPEIASPFSCVIDHRGYAVRNGDGLILAICRRQEDAHLIVGALNGAAPASQPATPEHKELNADEIVAKAAGTSVSALAAMTSGARRVFQEPLIRPATPTGGEIMEATAAQHVGRPKGEPAQFVRNGKLETCRCRDCRNLARSSAGIGEDWSCAADFLDGIEVDENGMCRWSDVANAQTHIRHSLRSVQPRPVAQPSAGTVNAAFSLASDIEDQTFPVMRDLLLLSGERQLIIRALRTMNGVAQGSTESDDELEAKKAKIARAIYDVSIRWIAGNFPADHEFLDFSQVSERDCNLHFEYAEAVLAALALPSTERQP